MIEKDDIQELSSDMKNKFVSAGMHYGQTLGKLLQGLSQILIQVFQIINQP